MTIVFVRHAQTAVNPDIHPSKWELSPQGKEQANQLSHTLQQLDFVPDFIYTSSEDKTMKTMEPYNQAVHGNIFATPQFDELHLPVYHSTIEEFQNARKQQFEQPNQSLDGGETPVAALDRFKSGLDLITEENAIICTHGTILSLYLADYHGWNTEKTFEFWKSLPFGEVITTFD